MSTHQRVVWLAPQAAFKLADQKFGSGKGKEPLLRHALHDRIRARQDVVRVECSDGWASQGFVGGEVYIPLLLEFLLDAGKPERDREYPHIRFLVADADLGEYEWGTMRADATLSGRVYVSGLQFSSQHIREAFDLAPVSPAKVEWLTHEEVQSELNTPRHLRQRARPPRGRPKGIGSYEASDAPTVAKASQAMLNGLNQHEVAQMFASELIGGGTFESKVRRLRRRLSKLDK